MKTSTKIAAALCLFNSANIYALGVGDIVTSTALNQVLKAKIPLISSKGEDPTNVHINIASIDIFKRAGIDRPHYLTELKFEPVLSENGEIVIDVSSSSNIKEPFVNFILEVEWPEGRTLKEFTILLDPPSTMPISRSPTIKRATAQETTIKPAEKKTPKKNTSRVSSSTPIGNQYGPTKHRDNVWDIAKNLVKNSPSATHQQMMMALYDNNPKAFYKKNINALKKGVILQAPSSTQLQNRTAVQAKADFNEQNVLWKSSVSQKTQKLKKPLKKSHKETKNSALGNKQKVNTNPELSLLSLKDKKPTTSSSAGNTDTAEAPKNSNNASIQASAAIEMATSLEEQNKEVTLRLTELELQVEKLQRLLVLKNEQLTQLQIPATLPVSHTPPILKEAGENEISEWLQVNSTYIYTGGGLIILLLALLLARRKNGKPEDDAPTPSVSSEQNIQADALKKVDEPAPTTLFSTPEEPLLSEFTSTEFNSAQQLQESDPITESDVYIAYGRYQQAEDIIQNALENEPDNQAYTLKLLDVFYASSNAERFEEVAASLTMLKDSDPQAWASIEKMGAELSPNSTLFNTPGSVETTAENDQDDFGLEPTYEHVTDDTKADETDSGAEAQGIDNGIDFNIVEPELATDEGVDSTDNDNKKDFEFDFDLIQPTQNLDESTPDNFDLDTLESDDTRLSLAQAYIEMEDYISAKESLLEVLETGNLEQQQTAQDMLDKLP